MAAAGFLLKVKAFMPAARWKNLFLHIARNRGVVVQERLS
jgi:hypothetical protein